MQDQKHDFQNEILDLVNKKLDVFDAEMDELYTKTNIYVKNSYDHFVKIQDLDHKQKITDLTLSHYKRRLQFVDMALIFFAFNFAATLILFLVVFNK